jgi:hypothetical protein
MGLQLRSADPSAMKVCWGQGRACTDPGGVDSEILFRKCHSVCGMTHWLKMSEVLLGWNSVDPHPTVCF